MPSFAMVEEARQCQEGLGWGFNAGNIKMRFCLGSGLYLMVSEPQGDGQPALHLSCCASVSNRRP